MGGETKPAFGKATPWCMSLVERAWRAFAMESGGGYGMSLISNLAGEAALTRPAPDKYSTGTGKPCIHSVDIEHRMIRSFHFDPSPIKYHLKYANLEMFPKSARMHLLQDHNTTCFPSPLRNLVAEPFLVPVAMGGVRPSIGSKRARNSGYR